MHSNKSKQKRRGKKNRAGSKQRIAFPKQQKFLPARSMPLVAPDQMNVPLRYRYQGTLYSLAGPVVKRLTPNAAYDVDPDLGSTETYGFDEYAALYSYYRVVAYKYRIQVANLNATQPIFFYVLNTNTDPVISGNRFDLYSTNPYCYTRLLGPNPAPHATSTLTGKYEISQILGAPVVETEDNYRSLTTGVPLDLTWLTCAAEAAPTVAGGDGIINLTLMVDLTIYTRFYGREVDLSLGGVAHLSQKVQKMVLSREAYLLQKKSGQLPWQKRTKKE